MRRLLPTVLLTFACGPGPLVFPEEDPAAPGPHAVGHATATAVDADRDDRALPLQVWYPGADDPSAAATSYALGPGIALPSELAREALPLAPEGPFPVVVFSHGYGAIHTQSVELCEGIASHGFVVVAPEHIGNSQGAPGDAFEVAAAKRVPDVSFVLDQLTAWNDTDGHFLHGGVDPGRVAVVGHSFGGMTALGSAGGWAGADPDDRVDAIVPISAVVDATLQEDVRTHPYAGFTEAQLAAIEVPALLLGGTLDVDVLIANNALAFERMTSSPAVYDVGVIGATHTSFSNVCQIGDLLLGLGFTKESWPVLGAGELLGPYEETCEGDALDVAEVRRLTLTMTVAFLRRHVLAQEPYGAYLTARFTEGEPTLTFDARPERP